MATKEDLRQLQALPLGDKVERTLGLVSEWYAHWDNQCYVSFSGGKDSTVLADIVAKWCYIAEVPLYLMFVDTGLEYPEIKKHVSDFADYLRVKYGILVYLDVIRPKMSYKEVIRKCGYPVIGKRQANCIRLARENFNAKKYSYRLASLGFSAEEALNGGFEMPSDDMILRYQQKNNGSKFSVEKYRPLLTVDFCVSDMCCDIMKKAPAKEYEKSTGRKDITGQTAEESAIREAAWLKNGCNAFSGKHPISNPLSFWLEQDILSYIKANNIPISSVYGDVVYALDPEQIRMDENFCGEKLCTTRCDRTGCIFCGFGAHLEKDEGRFEKLKSTHRKLWDYCIYGGGYDPEDGLWKPTNEGLGMGHVFDVLNGLYGENFIRYGREDINVGDI